MFATLTASASFVAVPPGSATDAEFEDRGKEFTVFGDLDALRRSADDRDAGGLPVRSRGSSGSDRRTADHPVRFTFLLANISTSSRVNGSK